MNNILVTRFSLRVSKAWEDKAYMGRSRSEWLRSRFNIFNNTLVSSVKHQTVLPTHFILLLDPGDMGIFEECCSRDIAIEPLYANLHNYTQMLADRIKSLGLKDIAVSRIDSDDLISKDYFREVNAAINSSRLDDNFFLVSTRGYRATSKKVQSIFYNCSPFLTSYTYNPSLDNFGVYSFKHKAVIERTHDVMDIPAWIQYIHGTNIANSMIFPGVEDDEFRARASKNVKLVATKPVDIDREMLARFPALSFVISQNQ